MKLVSIYTLADPRTPDNIRYVGKTRESLGARLRGHIRGAKRGHVSHKDNWIRGLLTQGFIPVIDLLELVLEVDWQEKERFWIEDFRFLGFKLTNQTRGGDGLVGYKVSEVTREKLRFTQQRCWQDPEHRKRMSCAQQKRQLENPHSAETKEKIRQSRLGRPGHLHSAETKERIRQTIIGCSRSAETKEKMKLAQQRRFQNPEQCKRRSIAAQRQFQDPKQRAILLANLAKGRLANLSHPVSVETKEKMSISQKRRYHHE